MSNSLDHWYFLKKEDPYITVETHEYHEKSYDDGKPLENAQITIDANNLEINISIPKKTLKKLIVAGQKYLETNKKAAFCGSKLYLGIEDKEIIPASRLL